jgi:hypothetical protein
MTFVNESINTDFTSNMPPTFMGIDGRNYVRMIQKDVDDDPGYEKIFNF